MKGNTIWNDDSARVGFAYHKSDDKVVLKDNINNEMTASASENIPNFRFSATRKDSKSVNALIQQGTDMKYNSQFNIENSTLTYTIFLAGVMKSYRGKCYSGEFIKF